MYFPSLQALFSVFSTLLIGTPPSTPLVTSLLSSPPRCIQPTVRREWRALTLEDQANWIGAVKCLNRLPHDELYIPTGTTDKFMPPLNTSSSYYDDIVYFHVNNDPYVHFTGLFFPWHRWVIHNFEQAMRRKCGYTGPTPYWDWTKDSADVFNSPIFQGTDPDTSIGGWGVPSDDYRVEHGAFSSASTFSLAYPSPHTLRRIYSLYPYLKSLHPEFLKNPNLPANASFTSEIIQSMTGGHRGDFKGFQTDFEHFQGPHAAIHLMVGGDLASSCPSNAPKGCAEGSQWAPNDPLFWLHHARIDKVWNDWQRIHEDNLKSFEGGSVQRLENVTIHKAYPNGGPPFLDVNSPLIGDGLFPDMTISDVLNTTGGYLCYIYE